MLRRRPVTIPQERDFMAIVKLALARLECLLLIVMPQGIEHKKALV